MQCRRLKPVTFLKKRFDVNAADAQRVGVLGAQHTHPGLVNLLQNGLSSAGLAPGKQERPVGAATGEMDGTLTCQFSGSSEGLVERGARRVESTAGQEVACDQVEEFDRGNAIDVQVGRVSSAGQSMCQQFFAAFAGGRVILVLREGGRDDGDRHAGPARCVAAEFSARHDLDETMNRQQAADGFGERVLARASVVRSSSIGSARAATSSGGSCAMAGSRLTGIASAARKAERRNNDDRCGRLANERVHGDTPRGGDGPFPIGQPARRDEAGFLLAQQVQVASGPHAGDDARRLGQGQRQATQRAGDIRSRIVIGHEATPPEICCRGRSRQDLEMMGLGVGPYSQPGGNKHMTGMPLGQQLEQFLGILGVVEDQQPVGTAP